MMNEIAIRDYTYTLPTDKIAFHPLEKRDDSKLLVYQNGHIHDDQFLNLADQLPRDCLLILNNTRVIEARVLFQKNTGGVIEIFCLEPYQQSMELSLLETKSVQWKCLVGGASKWKHGQALKKEILIGEETVELTANYIEKLDDGFVIEFAWNNSFHFADVLHTAGNIPLPPYIKRGTKEIDAERYQTIFGKHNGSVAAPTAALHFTEQTFNAFKKKNITTEFITLNVGAGTFKPVKAETIAEHQMHGEDFIVSMQVIEKMISAEKIIAVGTTSLRTIETLHWLGVKLLSGIEANEWTLEQWEAYDLNKETSYKESFTALLNWMQQNSKTELHCRTSLLIAPGYQFNVPEALITNFHQPQSTLLLLVAAFIGVDWKKVYQHALENNYRFLSYGDSSLLLRKK